MESIGQLAKQDIQRLTKDLIRIMVLGCVGDK